MSYKVKSALYFFSFLAAVTIYYSLDNERQIDAIGEKLELAKDDVENNSLYIIALKD